MNVEIGAKAALFPEKEYISRIFVAVRAHKFWAINSRLSEQKLCLKLDLEDFSKILGVVKSVYGL